jgi:queuosine precursor transporter
MNAHPFTWRYFNLISAIFVAVLLIANTVGGKIFTVSGLNLPGGVVVFPISYIFGDILTEVYGYRASRRVIWTGLACALLMSTVYLFVQQLPPAAFWPHQAAYDVILGFAPRITIASIVAYFVGEFCNSYVLAKMKIWTRGRHLWTRTIGSTIVGEGVDTIVFCTVAFTGVFPAFAIFSVIVANYLVKVVYEVIATPITYAVVGHLKKVEGVDVYDYKTKFNPFILEPIADLERQLQSEMEGISSAER